jgi:hypothetical protein
MANVKISGLPPPFALPAAGAVTGAEVIPMDQLVSGTLTTVGAKLSALYATSPLLIGSASFAGAINPPAVTSGTGISIGIKSGVSAAGSSGNYTIGTGTASGAGNTSGNVAISSGSGSSGAASGMTTVGTGNSAGVPAGNVNVTGGNGVGAGAAGANVIVTPGTGPAAAGNPNDGVTAIFTAQGYGAFEIDQNGNVLLNANGAALATNATNAFTYIPACAGTPTGTPTSVTGAVPIVYDTTGHKLWVYRAGAWAGVAI